MANGYSPCDQEVLHVQKSYKLENGQYWTPRNTNHRRVGEMVSIQWGLQNSDNWVTAELMSRATSKEFKRLLESFRPAWPHRGGYGHVPRDTRQPSARWSRAIRPSSMTACVDPLMVTQIEDMNGNIVATFAPQTTEVLDLDAANKMLYMLQSVVAGGTASRLRYAFGLDAFP